MCGNIPPSLRQINLSKVRGRSSRTVSEPQVSIFHRSQSPAFGVSIYLLVHLLGLDNVSFRTYQEPSTVGKD